MAGPPLRRPVAGTVASSPTRWPGERSTRRTWSGRSTCSGVSPPHPTNERTEERVSSLLKQSRAVWAVAFACAIAFMGIGLVDPILKPIADELGAWPIQVSLLFTSYMAVMGVAMLITGIISSRIGAKRTLLAGLVLIIVFAALAGASDSIGAIVGFR